MSNADLDPLTDPKRLLNLLSIGSTSASWAPAELGAILAHQLDAPLAQTLPDVGGETAPWPTLRAMLNDPSPPVAWLEKLKRFAKDESVNEPSSSLPKDVATVLYVVAIVVGRLAGHAMTKLDDAALRERVTWAKDRPWIDPDLRGRLVRFLA